MHQLDLFYLVWGKPVIFRATQISTPEQQIELIVFIIIIRISVNFGGKMDKNIQRSCSTEFLINEFQTLMNFSIFTEKIDKAVFYFQPGNSINADPGQENERKKNFFPIPFVYAGKFGGK